MLGSGSIPDSPLPPSVSPAYPGEIPKELSIEPFRDDQKLGVRVHLPVFQEEAIMGVLVGEIFYTQDAIERYAALSKTDINIFVRTVAINNVGE